MPQHVMYSTRGDARKWTQLTVLADVVIPLVAPVSWLLFVLPVFFFPSLFPLLSCLYLA